MLDLTKVKLPDSVEVEGSFFNVKTDFRVWLNFGELINNKESTLSDFDYIYENKKPGNKLKGIEKLIEFYAPPKELPRSTGSDGGEIVLDYKLDAELIYAAFYEVYKIDLLATDEKGKAIPLHWYKFQALLNGLHNTKLNEIMSYRSFEDNPKETGDYYKQMRKLKRAWRLPQNMELSEGTKQFNSLFKKKN